MNEEKEYSGFEEFYSTLSYLILMCDLECDIEEEIDEDTNALVVTVTLTGEFPEEE